MTTLLGVDLRGRRVLVAGGGPVAALKARGLAADGALVDVVSPVVCESLRDLIDEARVHWHPREVLPTDGDDAWLVIAATGDREVDTALCERATAHRVFSVCAGASEHGTARNPAVTEHAGVIVGVVSAARPDPGRVVRVRDALADHLASGGVDLRTRRRSHGAGRVVLVGGGPGAEDLITVRGRLALAQADVVVTDRLGPVGLLRELPASVEVIDVGKRPDHHPVPQPEINRILVEHAHRGRTVVRLKGGDPFVYGRGGEEVLSCAEAGVPVEVIPGVSSAMSAPLLAGIPLSHRGTVGSVLVTHGHELPSRELLDAVARERASLVILMGVALLAGHVNALLQAGADPALPIAIVERASLPDQRVTRRTLASIDDVHEEVAAPAVIVVGRVADPSLLAPQHVAGADLDAPESA